MEPVYLALIVAVPAMLSPLLLAWLTNRNLRQVKEQDWARQDVVAVQVAEAARLLKENTRIVTVASAETHQQLKTIHTLVNSTLTAAMQGRLDANRKGIGLMRRVIAMNKAINIEPSTDALAEIDASEKEIASLEMEIADRVQQAKVVLAQRTDEQ